MPDTAGTRSTISLMFDELAWDGIGSRNVKVGFDGTYDVTVFLRQERPPLWADAFTSLMRSAETSVSAVGVPGGVTLTNFKPGSETETRSEIERMVKAADRRVREEEAAIYEMLQGFENASGWVPEG